jgi:glycosyltransferase involved in cell wall biosynthesis
MKVVHVSAYDLPGQRFNGMVIHRKLLSDGHESDYLVDRKYSEDNRVHALGPWPLRRLNRLARRWEESASRQSDLCVLGLGAFTQRSFRAADLIHLQLLHARSFFSMRLLPYIANGSRPVLWTLHDPWITTGHCVHSLDCERWRTGCGACPDLSLPLSISHDRTAENWELKRSRIQRAHIHLIVASAWMERRVADSPILRHLPRTVIPFGLDSNIFRPGDKALARVAFQIPPEARVAAVRWTPHNILKGTKCAEEALMRLPDGIVSHVLCFESDGSDVTTLKTRYSVIPIPWMGDGKDVARAMTAADVFIMPSIGETFGMMAIEAMACGTPVVVFEGTALPETIDAPRCGCAVPKGDSEALANALMRLMTNVVMHDDLTRNGLALVSENYTEPTYVSRHVKLYEQLIDERRGRT